MHPLSLIVLRSMDGLIGIFALSPGPTKKGFKLSLGLALLWLAGPPMLEKQGACGSSEASSLLGGGIWNRVPSMGLIGFFRLI